MKKLITFLMTALLVASCAKTDKEILILDIENFLNNLESSYYDITDLSYHFLTTPIRVNQDGYMIIENEDNFNYCPGNVKLTPTARNLYSFPNISIDQKEYTDVSFYNYEVIYKCKNIKKSAANIYFSLFESNQEHYIYLITTSLDDYLDVIYTLEAVNNK